MQSTDVLQLKAKAEPAPGWEKTFEVRCTRGPTKDRLPGSALVENCCSVDVVPEQDGFQCRACGWRMRRDGSPRFDPYQPRRKRRRVRSGRSTR